MDANGKEKRKEKDVQEVNIIMKACDHAANEVNIFFCCDEDHKKSVKVE